jgi:hypothetical protein
MTKKETIFKHWADLNIASPFGICTNTGWYCGFFCNGIDDIKEIYGDSILELMDFEIEHDGLGKFRPKSLRGIEDNNGWIKIERVEDLPTNGSYKVILRDSGAITTLDFTLQQIFNDLRYIVELYSHYKPIEEEKKPLY